MILQKNFITEGHKRRRNRGELARYTVDEMYEPLISVEEYEQAQRIRQKRAAEADNAHVTLTRFSGLVKCGHCGFGVSRRTAKGVKRWVCNTRERCGIDACDMQPLMEAELREAAVNAVGDVTDDEFRMLVQRIVIYGDRIEFIMSGGKIRTSPRKYERFNAKCAFSGKVICGMCGAKLSRDTWCRWSKPYVKIVGWGCTGPRSACSLHRILEEHLLQATADVLVAKDSQPAFAEHVRQAIVFNDRVEFELRNGETRTWVRSAE